MGISRGEWSMIVSLAQSLEARIVAAHQLRGAKRGRPHAQGREDQLGPDALGVEVGQPLVDVPRALGGHGGLHELFLGDAGQPAAKHLAVNVDGLPGAVRVLLAARHQFGQSLRQSGAPQVLGLDEVGVARIGPQFQGTLLHGRGHLLNLELRSNTVNDEFRPAAWSITRTRS